MTKNNKVLVVVGGGAAGFFCAINAKMLNPLLKVIIIEKTGNPLKKVKISGGGRCNVTHYSDSISDMIKSYPRGDRFLKKAFNNFFTSHTIDWFLQRNVKLKIEPDGRMFPESDSSQTIIDCFMEEINKLNIELVLHTEVKSVRNQEDMIELLFASGRSILSHYVCITTGGFPKITQFDWLKALGHSIQNPVPSLFTFNIEEDSIKKLMGVSVACVNVKLQGTKFNQNGALLITHWGFSGPSILKLSSFAARYLAEKNYIFKIIINWVKGATEQNVLDQFKSLRYQLAPQKFLNRNPFYLPQRLWEYLMKIAGVDFNIRWADLPSRQQNIFIKNLCSHEFTVVGKTTFKEEFVTSGGINTNEICDNTMESKIFPNLFFAGEVLNIDGITGGYNFQSAWTTGWMAGSSIANKSLILG